MIYGCGTVNIDFSPGVLFAGARARVYLHRALAVNALPPRESCIFNYTRELFAEFLMRYPI